MAATQKKPQLITWGLNTAVIILLGLLSLVYAADKKRLDEVCAEAPKTVTRVAVLESSVVDMKFDIAEIKKELRESNKEIKQELRDSHSEIMKLLRER